MFEKGQILKQLIDELLCIASRGPELRDTPAGKNQRWQETNGARELAAADGDASKGPSSGTLGQARELSVAGGDTSKGPSSSGTCRDRCRCRRPSRPRQAPSDPAARRPARCPALRPVPQHLRSLGLHAPPPLACNPHKFALYNPAHSYFSAQHAPKTLTTSFFPARESLTTSISPSR